MNVDLPSEAGNDEVATTVGGSTREELLAELAVMYGIEDPPPVGVVRERTPGDDGLDVVGECLQERGWPVDLEGEGFMIFEVPVEQQEALNLDQYICDAQYPVAAEYTDVSRGAVVDGSLRVSRRGVRAVRGGVRHHGEHAALVGDLLGWTGYGLGSRGPGLRPDRVK
ncbi:hypothetical protein [uncultured Serinicoccus sp.]|uniref:hypothetical protein n=1 Tax=uncultured Serinicoccus sp. TaxID=735514 RepID=UPI002614ED88|nr:hypothetical protein [uncultured Serinicoccus sp.]